MGVRLTWEEPGGADEWQVCRASGDPTANPDDSQIARVAAGVGQYEDATVTDGAGYNYAVRPVSKGTSAETFGPWSLNLHVAHYSVPEDRRVTLGIFDGAGNLLREGEKGRKKLVSEAAGNQVFVWDGLGRRGQALPAGDYTVKSEEWDDEARFLTQFQNGWTCEGYEPGPGNRLAPQDVAVRGGYLGVGTYYGETTPRMVFQRADRSKRFWEHQTGNLVLGSNLDYHGVNYGSLDISDSLYGAHRMSPTAPTRVETPHMRMLQGTKPVQVQPLGTETGSLLDSTNTGVEFSFDVSLDEGLMHPSKNLSQGEFAGAVVYASRATSGDSLRRIARVRLVGDGNTGTTTTDIVVDHGGGQGVVIASDINPRQVYNVKLILDLAGGTFTTSVDGAAAQGPYTFSPYNVANIAAVDIRHANADGTDEDIPMRVSSVLLTSNERTAIDIDYTNVDLPDAYHIGYHTYGEGLSEHYLITPDSGGAVDGHDGEGYIQAWDNTATITKFTGENNTLQGSSAYAQAGLVNGEVPQAATLASSAVVGLFGMTFNHSSREIDVLWGDYRMLSAGHFPKNIYSLSAGAERIAVGYANGYDEGRAHTIEEDPRSRSTNLGEEHEDYSYVTGWAEAYRSGYDNGKAGTSAPPYSGTYKDGATQDYIDGYDAGYADAWNWAAGDGDIRDTIKVWDTWTGALTHTITAAGLDPQDVAFEPSSDTLVAIKGDGSIVRIALSDSSITELIPAADTENPKFIDVDFSTGNILVAEGGIDQAYKVEIYDNTGTRTGRLGANDKRPWVNFAPAELRNITYLQAGHDGTTYVGESAERTDLHDEYVSDPSFRRCVHMDAAGAVLDTFVGPGETYYTRSTMDPTDDTRFLTQQRGLHYMMQVDYSTGEWDVVQEIQHPEADGIMIGVQSHKPHWQIIQKDDGTLYLINAKGYIMNLLRVDVDAGGNWSLVPVASIGSAKPYIYSGSKTHEDCEVFVDAAIAAGYASSADAPSYWAWTDADGDGVPQAGEISFRTVTSAAYMRNQIGYDDNWNLYLENSEPTLNNNAWYEIPNAGTAAVPDWRWDNVAASTETHHEEFQLQLQQYAAVMGTTYAGGVVWVMVHFDRNTEHDQWGSSFMDESRGGVRMYGYDTVNGTTFSSAKRAVSAGWKDRALDAELEPGVLYHPEDFADWIPGLDRMMSGARYLDVGQFWTKEGLYAGQALRDRVADGLPGWVYDMSQNNSGDPGNPRALVVGDAIVGGTAYQLSSGTHVGKVIVILPTRQGQVGFVIEGSESHVSRSLATLNLPVQSTPADATGTGLTANYFTSKDLSGTAVLTKTEPRIWHAHPDHSGPDNQEYAETLWFDTGDEYLSAGLDPASFSTRFEGEFEPPMTDWYKFSIMANNNQSVRVWVDGILTIDRWLPEADLPGYDEINNSSHRKVSQQEIKLIAREKVPIRVEMFSIDSTPILSVGYENPSKDRKRIQQKYLYPA